ncbi:MAG: 3-oxoacyl-ACP reductase FabG [Bacteroidales bacterium]|jgi:3-oxoacyl-[acyl-carrier protein] reductase|nr:3-oxoacyl-ACP reductase FabG [Bacteroidales bacterium]
MNISLKNKTYIVTGGSKGIGRAIVTALVNAGANVAFTFNTGISDAESLVNALKLHPSKVKQYQLDITNFDKIPDFINQVISDFEIVDGIINNAGITRDNLFANMTADQWNIVIDTNMNALFHINKHIIPHFLNNLNGKIINISSASGLTSPRGQANYSASKAACIALTKTLAKEYAWANILVNAIAPGYISTNMTDFPKEKIREIKKMIPLKRFGQVEEISYCVVFLLSEYSNYITGQTIVIDGGIINSII